MNEFEQKITTIRSYMQSSGLDGLLLSRVSSFAWATCGAASYINTAVAEGTAMLLITQDSSYLMTTNIESPRLDKEEKLVKQGWKFKISPWYESEQFVEPIMKAGKLGADVPYPGAVDLSGEIARLRSRLSPEEQQRFRILSQDCAEAMNETMRAIRPGMTEFQIAGLLAGASEKRGVQAIVNLVATDERIFSYRHPLPTEKKMDRYAMVVLCGRRWGLVCSVTRLVHFGRLPEEVRRKANSVAYIDATFLHLTTPGNLLGDIFQSITQTYADQGYGGEWKLHHQGGPAGYEPREFLGLPGSQDKVFAGQTYAWNPSITGAKSEDTILVGDSSNEVLSVIPGWPLIQVEIDGKVYHRPDILEILS
jgi:Xaa-Pro aminopeptidase